MKANLYDVYDKDNYGDTSAHNGRLYSRLVNDSMKTKRKYKLDDSTTPRIPFDLDSAKAKSFTALSHACSLDSDALMTCSRWESTSQLFTQVVCPRRLVVQYAVEGFAVSSSVSQRL